MNAIEFPMSTEDKFWMEMKFYENKRIAEGKRAQKTEKWCKHTFLIGVKIGMETRKWLMPSMGGQAGRKELGPPEIRSVAQRSRSLEWFRANQINKPRQNLSKEVERTLNIWTLKEFGVVRKRCLEKE